MNTALQECQLRAHLSDVLSKYPDARAIGFTTTGSWTGPAVLDCDGTAFRVCTCPSSLAIRASLSTAEEEQARVVVLTPLADTALEEDIKARLIKQRLLETDAWTGVRQLFQAVQIDVALREHRWLAEALLTCAPPEGYPPSPGGVVTARDVWGAFLQGVLNLTDPEPDSRSLLEWSRNKESSQQYVDLPEEQRLQTRKWLERSSGNLGSLLLTAIEAGHSDDLWALGLVCEAVFSDEVDHPSIAEARIRMERFTGGAPITAAAGRQWCEDSLAILAESRRESRTAAVKKALARLDKLLGSLGIGEAAWRSSASPAGFELLLANLGAALGACLAEPERNVRDACYPWLLRLRRHLLTTEMAFRVRKAEMAIRLCRWLHGKEGEPEDAAVGLPALAQAYATEGGFVDWACSVLYTGDTCKALANSIGEILKQVVALHSRVNRRFAEALGGWCESDSESADIVAVEKVLRDVVAPLAEAGSVLLVVVDGMSCAVFRELLDDLVRRHHWNALRPTDGHWPRPVLAALPSLTEVSRRSLLCGKLTADSSDGEAKGFAANEDLRKASGALPPVLFGKSELRSESGDLSPAVRDAIAQTRRRVVGLIINAVDDVLFKTDQVWIEWTLDRIPTLEQALTSARTAGRTVLLVSDHGHVLDHGTKCREHGSHDRFRADDGGAGDGELQVHGPRVLLPEPGRMIAAYAEDLRYAKMKKNGYHGGISPQEIVIPLGVVGSGDAPEGWEPERPYRPAWWELDQELRKVPDGKGQEKSEYASADLPLFASAEAEDWVDELLLSPVFANQKQLAGRMRLTDDRVRRFCRSLDAAGGSLLLPALAQVLEMPDIRLRGLVSAMQRLLNVEGYSILTHDADSETVRLDRELCKQQFEIKK